MALRYLSTCAASRSTPVNVSRDVLRLHSSHFYAGVMMYGMHFHISFHISWMLYVKCLRLLFRQRLLHKHIITSHQSSKYFHPSIILNLHFHWGRLTEHRQKSFKNTEHIQSPPSFSFTWSILELALVLISSRPQDFRCDHRADELCCSILVKKFLLCFLYSTCLLILLQGLLLNIWNTCYLLEPL